jgi:hypothetical protein
VPRADTLSDALPPESRPADGPASKELIGTMTRTRRLLVALAGVALLSTLAIAPAGAAARAPGRAVASFAPAGSTPSLIEAAVASGELSRETADRYLAYALANPTRLPARFSSTVPWRGTLPLLELERRAAARGTTVDRLAGAVARGSDGCGGYAGATPKKRTTEHFLIRYDPASIARLDVGDYAHTLERSWKKEITVFGWPKPPFKGVANGLYHVRIENLGGGLYGFVTTQGSTAGFFGNNPATPWADGDAYSSCMVLNQNYRGFPSPPLKSLQATAAHEFNHAIQFGEGGLTGAGEPDLVFTEAGATWMEDEVFDGANDNYFYLWPPLDKSMGAYGQGQDIYSYWVTLRAMTERFGTGVAGGGEDVMQEFWEETSRETANNLSAMNGGLALKGSSLPDAFHSAAVSLRFARTCGGGYVYPYCLEEGAAYRSVVGFYPNDDSIGTIGGSAADTIRDDYAMRFVGLPKTGGVYDISLSNDAAGGGELRGSVVCDNGTGLEVNALSMVAGVGDVATLTNFDPTGCTSVVLVITNQDQHGANPSTAAARAFSVDTA